MRCATHPDVETNLRCGKCGKPICPKCLVQTPVGARCPDCAQLQKLPTFRVTPRYYLQAISAAVGMIFACGAAWGAIRAVMPFVYFNFLLASAFGFAIGEVVSLSVNRKRSRGLVIIAGIAVALTYLVYMFPPWGVWLGRFNFLDPLAVALGVYVAIVRVR